MLHVVLLRDEGESCDRVLAMLRELQDEFPRMRIRERPLEQEPVLAGRLGVTGSPAVIVNDQLAFQGEADRQTVRTYLRNVLEGLHADPEAYPPEDERDPENQGQEATGSMAGGGLPPSHSQRHGGRHS